MIDKLIKIIFTLLIFLLPLYYLPAGNYNPDFDKQSLLVFFVLLLLSLSIIKILKSKKITYINTPVNMPLLGFGIASVLSVVIFSPDKYAAFSTPLSAGSIIVLIVLFFLIVHEKVISDYQNLFTPLAVSSSIIAVSSILGNLKLFNFSHTPLGSSFSSVTFLFIVLVYLISYIFTQKPKKIFRFLSLLLSQYF